MNNAKNGSSDYNGNVQLLCKPGQVPGTGNYYPRTLIWDYNNGFGALSPFEYFEPKTDIKALERDFGHSIHTQGQLLTKSGYQKSLDKGLKENADRFRMKYWSDFSNVIYKPESLMKLNRWDYSFEHQEGHLRSHDEIKFDTYSVGSDEFKENQAAGIDALEDNFRKLLEECDTFNGLNLLTETDSAWGGFSAKCLTHIQDEYIPKSPVLVWSLTNDTPGKSLSYRKRMSRIKTVRDLVNASSLFIPISTKPSTLPNWVDSNSNWQVSSYQAIPLDAVNALTISRAHHVGLNIFAGGITDGMERKIISDVSIPSGKLSCTKIFGKHKNSHVFGRSVISESDDVDKVCDFAKLKEYGTDSRNLKAYRKEFRFPAELDSFPEKLRDEKLDWCSFDITDKPKNAFGSMLDYVTRYCREDEREELKEDLSDLREQYVWGYDSDDDDYDG